MKQRSDRYRGLAVQFESMAGTESIMEQITRKVGEDSAESAMERAGELAKEAAEEQAWARMRQRARDRSGGIDPGIFARRQPSTDFNPPDFRISDLQAQWASDASRRANESLEMARAHAKRVDHFGRMREKYERAARYPWLLVEPDQPEPVRGPM